MEKPTDDISLEEADAILKEQRRILKEYHQKNNQKCAEELGLKDMNMEYICDSYAPYISVEFEDNITEDDLDKIYKVAKNRKVNKLYVKGSNKKKAEVSDAIKSIDASAIVNADKSAGKGVVVGLLEAGGVPNVNNAALKDATIKIFDQFGHVEEFCDHANMMAIIIHSIAPGATILSSDSPGGLSEEINWMIDNNANVINMSFGLADESTNGEYGVWSSYCDYVSRFAWVTFVGSAGNQKNGNIYITQPNGYNTVTVGAGYTSSGMKDSACKFSSYEEKYNIELPNIVAPGIGYIIPTYQGLVKGTSEAAALTSGAIAVLMQKKPVIRNSPDSALSILMASAERSRNAVIRQGLDERIGAGALNLSNAIVAADNTVRFTRSSDSIGNYVSSKSVYLSSGQSIRVAFASLVNSRGYVTTGLVTDYDVYLFNGNGEQVASCTGTNNCELVYYKVPVSGYYTIKIKQYSAKKTNYTDYCSYSYFVQ